jgi:hypothetical protein
MEGKKSKIHLSRFSFYINNYYAKVSNSKHLKFSGNNISLDLSYDREKAKNYMN